MNKCPCKVWNSNRQIKKTFMTFATLKDVIQQANSMGIGGTNLVLECDGTEICDDSVLQYYLKTNEVLMLIGDEEWKEGCTTSSSQLNDQMSLQDFNDIHSRSGNIQYYDDSLSSTVDNNTIKNHNNDIIVFEINDDIQVINKNDTTPPKTRMSSDTEFQNFKIPWSKLPSDILQLLKNKKKLDKRLNVFGNLIVDEMRQISTTIPMSVLRSVVQQAVNKYTESFLEKDCDGNIISTKTVPLLTLMRNRVNFLNRAPKRDTSLDSDIPIKDRKRSNLYKKTCVNWQPSNSSDKSSLEYKQQELIKLKDADMSPHTKVIVKKFMGDCYEMQRKYFNSMNPIPTIKQIKAEWPFIFRKEFLYDHFKCLMNLDSLSFEQNFKKEEIKIYKFFESFKNGRFLDTLKENSKELSILKSIAKYFGEDIAFIYKFFEFGTTVEEIKDQIPTNTPFISVVQTGHSENSYIFIEKEMVVDEKQSFMELLIQAINFYFVFNILYPSQISQTMEFIFRYFYKYYPESVRGAKRNINNIQKINTLIKKITSFN